jgi:hypothetical protein
VSDQTVARNHRNASSRGRIGVVAVSAKDGRAELDRHARTTRYSSWLHDRVRHFFFLPIDSVDDHGNLLPARFFFLLPTTYVEV